MQDETRITTVRARQVLDSRGKPTVEVEVTCGEAHGRAIAPSGASTGRFEACELRDGDNQRYAGQGVLQAVANVNNVLAPAVIGLDARDQRSLDQRLIETDGTDDKSRLGANAILGVSLAAAHAAAAAQRMPLVRHLNRLWGQLVDSESAAGADDMCQMSMPLPMVNMISGGLHAGGQLDFQDYLIIPVGAASYSEALEWIVDVYRKLGSLLRDAGHEGYLVGDEGGYGPKLPDNESALSFVVQAIECAGREAGDDIAIGLDVASTHFFRDGAYYLKSESGANLSAAELTQRFVEWANRYPIVSIEDGLAEDDWDGWKTLTEALGDRLQLLGDDLFTTNVTRIEEGIRRGVANSVLIKLNQVGSLWETLQAIYLSRQAGYRPVVSARSGETEDATIADLAVATAAGQIKIGSIARSERLAKYNQLLRLEDQLGNEAPFAGGDIVRPAQRPT
ncbi:MAG: phosphopyruvate hydratase [Planctomycetota bacterium]|nr:MAG: phosphopyruvate hydratase [Planctomycetota bacterium]REK27272.1 MAG: phosphopyruvate hydratase [Planctomycetota bacterium]REK36707.1 MAG: phosphopyruvate hydratase [Planctomycetota bacterium]